MVKTRAILFATGALLAVSLFVFPPPGSPTNISKSTPETAGRTLSVNTPHTMLLKGAEAKIFVKQKEFNDNFCFLIDMKIASGKNRFLIYDLNKDTLINASVVTHGRCNEWWLEGRKYSNEPGSGCTSLGKYRIGMAYNGKFGLAYKLHGLEKTNSNAFMRYAVLHGRDCVPDDETEDEICQSDGCPTVSFKFLKTLSQLIDASPKPTLLWIFDSSLNEGDR